jgi:tetratricopeptide (TPR) repeat protein
MKEPYKITLIFINAVVLSGSIFASVLFYAKKQSIQKELGRIGDLLQIREQNINDLKKENTELGAELAKKSEAIGKISQENERLKQKINNMEDDLVRYKINFEEYPKAANLLREEIKDNNKNIAYLRNEISLLKSKLETESRGKSEGVISGKEIMQNTSLFKREDFAADYTGQEIFLTDCKSPLCKKILLNSQGIQQAVGGQIEEAAELFKEALTVDPDYKPAQLNLRLVQDRLKTK